MTSHARLTLDEARAAGERIGIDWDASWFGLEQFQMGMDVELEHGSRDPETNVTGDDVIMTAKIARAHLNEFPDYYTRLAKMESEAGAEANGPRRASERVDMVAAGLRGLRARPAAHVLLRRRAPRAPALAWPHAEPAQARYDSGPAEA